jgi:hypothetical protein
MTMPRPSLLFCSSRWFLIFNLVFVSHDSSNFLNYMSYLEHLNSSNVCLIATVRLFCLNTCISINNYLLGCYNGV